MFLAVNYLSLKLPQWSTSVFWNGFYSNFSERSYKGQKLVPFFVSGDVEWSVSVSVIFADDTTCFRSQFSMELIKTGIDYILNRAELME